MPSIMTTTFRFCGTILSTDVACPGNVGMQAYGPPMFVSHRVLNALPGPTGKGIFVIQSERNGCQLKEASE